ncbi:hypothetical protein, partial [Streptococcus pyogenes]|uniref:hypothetical protein n=1 Tax=Streptococcus pyogenes TaxID=1314 RepID=UPI000EEEC261
SVNIYVVCARRSNAGVSSVQFDGQGEEGMRGAQESRGLGDVDKRQGNIKQNEYFSITILS